MVAERDGEGLEEGESAEYTSLKVTKKLTARLKEMGKKGESYEAVIWRLIDGIADHEDKVRDLSDTMERLMSKITEIDSKIEEQQRSPKKK